MSIGGDIVEAAYENMTDQQKLEWAFKAMGVKYNAERLGLYADDGQSWAFYFDEQGKYVRSGSA